MASSQFNAHSEAPLVEQIITEFFAKSLHIILESRSPFVSSRNCYSGDPLTSSPSSSSSTSSVRPRDKWFNLALGDCSAALENMDLWGVGECNFEPLVIDVILVQRPSEGDQARSPSGGCLARNVSVKDQNPNCWGIVQDGVRMIRERSDKIIERWVVQYESRKGAGVTGKERSLGSKKNRAGSSRSPEMSAAQSKVYTGSIILLRSLYVTVRLLPAYQIFRDLSSTGQIRPYSLAHKISSFVEPFARVEDDDMKQFVFVPVDTPCGRLCLTVSYLETLEDLCLEPSTTLSARLISNYVGSPLAEPLKRFGSLPSPAHVPTDILFTRRPSWGSSHRATSSMSPSPSPSPTHSKCHVLYQNMNSDFPFSSHMPINDSPSRSLTANNSQNLRSFDGQCPSTSFLSSPSTPPNLAGHNSLSTLKRTESAPERIHLAQRNSFLFNDAFSPSPSQKGAKSGCSYLPGSATQASTCAYPPSKNQQKAFLPEAMMSCSSPRLQSCGSLSRLSMLDEFENFGIFCPFVDDDDFRTYPSEEGHPVEDFKPGKHVSVRKSQGAVVGELVMMLKSAQPLCQDSLRSETRSTPPEHRTWERGIRINSSVELPVGLQDSHLDSGIVRSSLPRSRTTSDAMKELTIYREMKDLLLRQGVSHMSDSTTDKPDDDSSSS